MDDEANVTKLDGGDFPVPLKQDASTLEAPDFTGEVVEIDLQTRTGRDALDVFDDRLDQALKVADIGYHKLLEIAVQDDGMATGGRGGRAGGLNAKTRQGEPAIILTVPPVQKGLETAVLYTDEAGRSRWIWPQPKVAAGATRGGGGDLVFYLPRPSAQLPPPAEAPKHRGELTKLGRRVVRVLYWATDRVVAPVARKVAESWENKRRPYAFRPFSDLTADAVPWDELASGRALLLLHGTFSSAAAAFAELPTATRDALAQHYGGRIFAFDHPSLHHSPEENVERFFEMLPQGPDLELDVVTHSRGGLVARELIERQHAARRKISVRRAVFVAAPNGGTKLADGDHGTDLLDSYTDLLTELPDDAFTFTIEGVLTLVKILAHGALAGLPGLNCMLPTGDYLKGLNIDTKYGTEYYAAAAAFAPQGQGLLGRFAAFVKGGMIFSVFGEPNDGVVPTRGCHDGNWRAASFPVPAERQLLFGPNDNVHHCNFFGQQQLADCLVRWLTT